MSSENNKRIAQNTLVLYFRMMLMMGISLYTSRIILNTLGVNDFGIYNVVGGIVTMFGFLNSAMASATQRFLSFELGKQDFTGLRRVFSMSVNIHATIAITVLLLAETIGLWFLNTQMSIPPARISAANWVYQFSIFTLIVTIMSVPYNALIISHERMSVFAWVSIVEVLLKLVIVFVLTWFAFDKLKLYSILVFSVAFLIRLLYGVYCKRNFRESRYYFFWDKKLYKTLLSYAGWNLWGNVAVVASGQGVNILLNIFFGPAVNAARGIAYQARGAVTGFVTNFQMALNPQIVKSYAEGDLKYMHQLIFKGARYSFFLLYLLSLPVLLQTGTILKWWLKIVPEYAIAFCQLVLINALIDSISGPLMTAAQATGKIKTYQGVVGGSLLFVLPISYLLFRLEFSPLSTFFVSVIVSVIALLLRLKIIGTLVRLSLNDFLVQVIFRVLVVVIGSLVLPLILYYSIDNELLRFLATSIVSVFSVLFSIYFFGLKKEEVVSVNQKLIQVLSKIKRK